jgi:hypothetical protein
VFSLFLHCFFPSSFYFLFNFFPSSFPSYIIYSFIYLLISPPIFYLTFICQLYFLHSSLFSFYLYLRRSSLRFLFFSYLFIYLILVFTTYVFPSFPFLSLNIPLFSTFLLSSLLSLQFHLLASFSSHSALSIISVCIHGTRDHPHEAAGSACVFSSS